MKKEKFRKLNIHLPQQPLINQRPWFIAGLLIAVIYLLIITCIYLAQQKTNDLPKQQQHDL